MDSSRLSTIWWIVSVKNTVWMLECWRSSYKFRQMIPSTRLIRLMKANFAWQMNAVVTPWLRRTNWKIKQRFSEMIRNSKRKCWQFHLISSSIQASTLVFIVPFVFFFLSVAFSTHMILYKLKTVWRDEQLQNFYRRFSICCISLSTF